MAKEVNAFTSGAKATGKKTSVAQYELAIRFDSKTRDGNAKSNSRTVTFPECLELLPLERREQIILEIMTEAARYDAKIDTDAAVIK